MVIMGEEIKAKNWTDAMLKGYSLLITKYQEILLSKYVSIDIEPYTLEMLSKKDPRAFSSLMSMVEEREIRMGICPIFHPFLPHLPIEALRAIFRITKEIFSRLSNFKLIWLPECGYSRRSFSALVKEFGGGYLLILDKNQVNVPPGVYSHLGEKVGIRDSSLSDEFSFSSSSPNHLISKVSSGSILATDLETLFYSPYKIDVMEKFIERCEKEGLKPSYERSPGGEIFPINFSSWSDYSLMGRRRDSRWLGLRREDMRAYYVEIFGKKTSQIWKRPFFSLISEAFLRTYQHLSENYWKNFLPSISSFLRLFPTGGGFLTRASFEVLSCFRSCPFFWEYPDTRVTFQAISILSNAISDASRGGCSLRDLAELLFDFERSYERYGCYYFEGVEGWESSKNAFFDALHYFVPEGVEDDIFRRASSFAFSIDPPDFEIDVEPSPPIASHVPSEAGFCWDVKEFCEERRWYRCQSLERTM